MQLIQIIREQILGLLCDYVSENEHCCPQCLKDVARDKLNGHEKDCLLMCMIVVIANTIPEGAVTKIYEDHLGG